MNTKKHEWGMGMNANGVPSQSPRLARRAYLGLNGFRHPTPTGLRRISRAGHNPVGVGDACRTETQGSSCLATAGLKDAIPLGLKKGSFRPGDDVNVTGLEFGKATEHFWHQRVRVFKTIRLGAQHDDGERQFAGFVLVRQVFVHGQEDVKLGGVGDQAEEFAILDARPARARNGLNFVSGQIPPQTCGQTFIQKNSHSGGLRNGCEHRGGGLFKERNGLLARNRGEVFEENVQSVASFKVIKQRPHGNARARKARRAAHDFRVNLDNGAFLHGNN